MSVKYVQGSYQTLDSSPITDSPYNEMFLYTGIFPPPGTFVMITEDDIFMITETTGDFMITEGS